MFLKSNNLFFRKWSLCPFIVIILLIQGENSFSNTLKINYLEKVNSILDSSDKEIFIDIVEKVSLGPTAVVKAKFSINDSTQCIRGNKFQFINTSTIDAGSLTYFWNFGDAITTTLKDPLHTYLYPGVYTVKLVVTGSLGGKDSTTLTVSVYNVPKSNFIINDSSQCLAGNSFELINQSTTFPGDNLTYLWKFGDSKTDTILNPKHTYDSAGSFKLKLFSTTNDGCTDSSVVNIIVFPTPKPAFSVNDTIQPYVKNNFIFTNLTKYTGTAPKYLWNFGDDSTSTNKDAIHNYKKFGKYNVFLTTKVDSTGCRDSVKLQVEVLPSANAKFSVKDSIICLSGNNVFFIDSSKVDAGELVYSWNFGDGDTSIMKSPIHQYKDTGTYKITLIVAGTLGGADTANKIISIKPMPNAGFKIDTVLKCFKGNSFLFTDTSSIFQGKLTNLWLFGDNDTSRLQSPAHSYSKAGVYTPTMIVRSEFGCLDSTSLIIEVLGELKSIFSINDSSQCYNGNLFKFNNKSKTYSGNTEFLWLFGDDSTSNIINPNYRYSKEGDFNVRLIAKHSTGCKDTSIVKLTVFPSPIAKFSINDTVQTLTDNDFILTNLTTISSGDLSYRWYFGDTTSPSDIINPRHQYDTVGSYTITLVTSSINGCIDSSAVGILIFGTVKAKCTVNNPEQCFVGNSYEFSSESTINGGTITYLWDFGDGFNAIGQYAFHKYVSPGTYSVKLFATSSAGGKDSALLSIKVNPMPITNFIINDSIQCITDNKFIFLNNSTVPNSPTPSVIWYLGDSTISIRQNIVYKYLQPGAYTVKLVATSNAGCKDSTKKEVLVGAQPQGVMYDSILTRKAFNTNLQARKFDNATYLWTPSILLNSDSTRTPVFFDSSQVTSRKYIIGITDQFGCIFYDTLKILFFTKIDILTPNAFTPNGDNLNDHFRPLLIGLKSLTFFKVYNRWGKEVFKTSDFKSSWDGSYKGALQPMDTYTWIVVGVDIDGKAVSKSGNFILIK